MKLKPLFIILSSFLILAVIVFSYFNYQRNHHLLLEKYNSKSKIDACNIRNNLTMMFDEIMYKHNQTLNQNRQIFDFVVKQIQKDSNTSLQSIKEKLSLQYPDRAFDLFLINKKYTIFDTTYAFDLGLDFKTIPGEKEKLQSLFSGHKNFYVSHLINDPKRNNFIQYFLKKPKDLDFIIEFGVVLDKDKIINKYLNNIRLQNKNLIDFNIFALNSSKDNTQQKVHKIMYSNTEYKTKQEIVNNMEHIDSFASIFSIFSHHTMPKSLKEAHRILEKELNSHNGILNTALFNNQHYTQKMLLPFNSYQNLQENRLGVYLMMQFNQNDIHKEISRYDFITKLFWLLFFIGNLLIIYVLYTYIIKPLTALNTSMQKIAPIKSPKLTNQNNEIGSMIKKYNTLFIHSQ